MPPLRWQNTKGHIHTLFLRALTQLCIARWFQKAKVRTKYVILSLISRIFQANFERFTFKTCFNCCRLKYDLSISVIFRISFLAGFCYLAPLCAVAWTVRSLHSKVAVWRKSWFEFPAFFLTSSVEEVL